MKVFKWTVTVLVTITAPIWLIPFFFIASGVDAAKNLHRHLWGK